MTDKDKIAKAILDGLTLIAQALEKVAEALVITDLPED